MTVNLLQYSLRADVSYFLPIASAYNLLSNKKKDIYKISHIDSIFSRESKQDEINLINCMFTKKLEEFINSKIKSDTGSRLTFGI